MNIPEDVKRYMNLIRSQNDFNVPVYYKISDFDELMHVCKTHGKYAPYLSEIVKMPKMPEDCPEASSFIFKYYPDYSSEAIPEKPHRNYFEELMNYMSPEELRVSAGRNATLCLLYNEYYSLLLSHDMPALSWIILGCDTKFLKRVKSIPQILVPEIFKTLERYELRHVLNSIEKDLVNLNPNFLYYYGHDWITMMKYNVSVVYVKKRLPSLWSLRKNIREEVYKICQLTGNLEYMKMYMDSYGIKLSKKLSRDSGWMKTRLSKNIH